MKRGYFISFEGAEATGKSTQIQMLAKALTQHGYKILVTREPGGTPFGEKLRQIVKQTPMHPRAELILFEASRAELVESLIKPHLAKGYVVICDRFQESSLVYQGMGRSLGLSLVKKANQLATQGLKSNLVILLNPKSIQSIFKRMQQRGSKDRIERSGLAFHKKVIQGYLRLAKQDKRFKIFSSDLNVDELHSQILSLVLRKLR